MKYFFFSICVVSAFSLALNGSSNPYSAYSVALEGALPHDGAMKDFLAPMWFFLPEVTSQQKDAKNVLKTAFNAKFLSYPTQIQINPRILEELNPHEKHCATAISQTKQCNDEKDKLQKQCTEETDELKNQIQEFSKNLNSIKTGYDAIYMSNLTYTKAVEKLNKAYENLKAVSPTENMREIIKAIKASYDLYVAATNALTDLNKSLEGAQVTIEVAIPNGATIRRMININIDAAKLGLKKL